MTVREAGEDDIEALARLRAQWREEPPTGEFVERFRAWYARERRDRWWWVAATDDDVVGMANCKLFERMPSPSRPPSRWAYVANVYVRPPLRGSGIGGQLMGAIVQRARDEGLARLVLAPSEQAVSLYGRHGFRSADELLLLPLGE